MAQLKSSLLALWKRGIHRGIVTVLRERGWTTALGALTGVFLLFQLLVFVLIGVEGTQSLLRARTDLRLEISQTAEDQEIFEFLAALGNLSYVENHTYITKEEAYAQMEKKDPELISFLAEFGLENPFPETVSVTLRDLENYPNFDVFLNEERWQNVIDPTFLSQATEQEENIYELLRVTNAGRSVAMIFLMITAAILVLVTTELVRRRVLGKAEEILVEHLSGAHAFSILIPYAVEAWIMLLTALIVSALLLIVFIAALPQLVPALGQQGALQSLTSHIIPLLQQKLPIYLLVELAITPVLAWFGAWLGVMPKSSPRALNLFRQ